MTGPRTGTLYWLPRILDDASLDAVETLLMIGLADHVNADDECFVGIERLAERARCSYGTARRRLAALEARGRLTRERRRREDGNLSTYLWSLVRDDALAPNLRASPARTEERDNQRAPGRAVTSAHQGARTEVPSEEPPSQEVTQRALALVVDEDAEFERFWTLYPKRDGKRLYKDEARSIWRKFPQSERDRAMRNVVHYAASGQRAKDPMRWLRPLRSGSTPVFHEWDEPAAVEQQLGKTMQSVMAMGPLAPGSLDLPGVRR